jgi:hypothetical protein
MRAKYVYESVNFERGKNPLDAMDIGRIDLRRFERAKASVVHAMKKLVDEFGGDYRIKKLPDKDSISGGIQRIRGYWANPEDPIELSVMAHIYKDENIIEYFIDDKKRGETWSTWTGREFLDIEESIKILKERFIRKNEWNKEDYIDKWPSVRKFLEDAKNNLAKEGLGGDGIKISEENTGDTGYIRFIALKRRGGFDYIMDYVQPDIHPQAYLDHNNIKRVPGIEIQGGTSYYQKWGPFKSPQIAYRKFVDLIKKNIVE